MDVLELLTVDNLKTLAVAAFVIVIGLGLALYFVPPAVRRHRRKQRHRQVQRSSRLLGK